MGYNARHGSFDSLHGPRPAPRVFLSGYPVALATARPQSACTLGISAAAAMMRVGVLYWPRGSGGLTLLTDRADAAARLREFT